MSILGLITNYGTQAYANSSTTKSSKPDYAQSLQEKFNYLNTSSTMNGIPTTVSVSPAFIEKCAQDPEKAAYLEENLAAIPSSVKSLCSSVQQAPGSPVVTYATYQIDDNGNITMMSGSTNDPDGKIARENAEKKAKEQQEAKKKLQNRATKHFSAQGKSVRQATEKLIKKVDFSDSAKTSGASIRKTDYIEISEEARLALEQDKELQTSGGTDVAEQSEGAQEFSATVLLQERGN